MCIHPPSTDGWDGSWEARWQQPKPNWQLHKSISSEDSSFKDQCIVSETTAENQDPNDPNGILRHHVCGAWDSTLWADGMGDVEEDGCVIEEDIFGSQLDSRSQNSSPVRRRAQERAGRVRGVLNRSCSVPDSNNPPTLPPTPHEDISVNVSDLTEIGAEECMGHGSVWSKRGDRETAPYECSDSKQWGSVRDNEMSEGDRHSHMPICGGKTDSDGQSGTRDDSTLSRPAQDPEVSVDSACNVTLNSNIYTPNNHMTKSMLCLNEESQDEVSSRISFMYCTMYVDVMPSFQESSFSQLFRTVSQTQIKPIPELKSTFSGYFSLTMVFCPGLA